MTERILLAFGLALLLFFYFLFIGVNVVRLLHASRSKTQDLLMAPVFGAVVTLIPVFFFNRVLGIPVMAFGPMLSVGLPLLAAAVLVIRARRQRSSSALPLLGGAADAAALHDRDDRSSGGPGWPLRVWLRDARDYLPFLLILLLAGYLIGRPMFTHGFDWLSFCNDDMANYTLASERFLRNGFLDVPASSALVNGTDYSQSYWFFHVAAMARAGSELLLAWTTSTTGLSPHQAFMPLIVSFHLALVSAASALILSSEERRPAAIVACFLLAGSAQITFGTVYQLVAQDFGLALLCINATLLLRTFEGVTQSALVRHGVLVAIGMTGQLLVYPEVNPFLAGGFLLFLIAMGLRRRLTLRPLLIVLGVASLLVLVLLNAYIYDALAFMYNQRMQAAQHDDPSRTLFPFFLIPSGFANFWGFVQITSMPEEPGFSIAIIGGAVVTAAALAAAAWLTWRGEAAAAITLLCAILSVFLFRNYSGFGLYKMAMFAQPFVLPTMALAWLFIVRRVRLPWAVWLLAILALPSMRVQKAYITYSADKGGSTFNEILGATRTKVIREFRNELAEAQKVLPPGSSILVDSYNISLTKILGTYTFGRETAFPASIITLQATIPSSPPEHSRQSYIDAASHLSDKTFEHVHEVSFEFDPAHPGRLSSKFFFYDQGGRPSNRPDDPDTLLVAGTRNISMFNRRTFGQADGNFSMLPLGQVRNHLLFVLTVMSQPYYKAGDATFISVYQLERDPIFYTDQTMAGVGRYFVFEVLNPDEEVRFCLDLTMTLKSDGKNQLPDAVAIGTERVPFPLVGRGACRVFSPPIKPQLIRGRYYVGIDLGEFGTQFLVDRTGIMTLFGNDVRLDRRKLVGFGRDISLISSHDYDGLNPPSAIRRWGSPESELRHPDLEFSGFYEDGWVAETGYLRLGQKPEETKLKIRGFVPMLDQPAFSTRLTVKVDGKEIPFTGKTAEQPIADRKLVIGPYELSLDVPNNGDNRRHIQLDFSTVQQLKDEDTRKAAARIEGISFEDPDEE